MPDECLTTSVFGVPIYDKYLHITKDCLNLINKFQDGMKII